MINIAIVEDSAAWRDTIMKGLKDKISDRWSYEVETFDNAESFEEKRGSYNIVFFDIELGDGKDGLTACRSYKAANPDREHFAVLLTSHLEYGRQGYLASAFRYIDKGNIENELQETIDSIFHILEESKMVRIPVKGGVPYEFRREDIVYIDTSLRNVLIWLKGGEIVTASISYADVSKQLEGDDYFEINRGLMVNLSYIIQVKEDFCIIQPALDKQTKLYISRRRNKEFLMKWMKYKLKHANK